MTNRRAIFFSIARTISKDRANGGFPRFPAAGASHIVNPTDALTMFGEIEVHPGRGMVARPRAGPDLAIDSGGGEAARGDRVEQQMVDADAGVAGEGVPPIIPEGVDRLARVEVA